MTLHIVKRDETLSSIARLHGTTAAALSVANQLGDASKLAVGQALLAPPYGAPGRSILVGGCARPGIGDAALYGALPYLTYLTPFAYRPRPDGGLAEPADGALIRLAYASDVAPLLMVSNEKDGGGPDGALARALLTEEAAQAALAKNLAALLPEKSYMGLMVDFEGLADADGPAYTAFLTRLKERLAPGGYLLCAALRPGDERAGAAVDAAAVGAVCDLVVLKAFQQAVAGPQAPAPIGWVKGALERAVGAVPGRKLLLGLAGHGYNWALPFDAKRPPRPVPLAEAPRIACENFADIRYDEEAQAPYFQYYDSNGTEHVVWFDDPRSILARLELAETYGLGGVSYWSVDRLYRPGFLALAGQYHIEKVFD